MRFEGSYSSNFSKRLKNCWCSVPCDNMYFWKNTDQQNLSFKGVNALHSCLKVCTCPSSPLMVCTWLSRSVRTWSTHSRQDAHAGNTSAFCKENNVLLYKVCLHVCLCVAVYSGVFTCSFESSSEELVPVFSPS